MMKILLPFILSILLFSCSNQNENSSQLDLSTDEAVMAELNKGRDRPINKDDICIERIAAFKDLILVGYFAHDRGCDGGEVFYKGKKYEDASFVKDVLNDNGWGDKSNRQDLAMKWVQEVSTKWSYCLTEKPENFDTTGLHPFEPVLGAYNKLSGNVSVTCWVQEPSGMVPENNYYKLRVDFAADGSISSSEVIDRFTVSFE